MIDVEQSNSTATLCLTVEGTTGAPATGVTVNTYNNAILYGDNTFAATNFTPVNGNNTYTAIAHDSLGRYSTNAITVYLPTNAVYSYDLNGNLLTDGTRCFAYDDENELISVWVTNVWKSQFQYDGKLRRRIAYNCARTPASSTQTKASVTNVSIYLQYVHCQ